MLGRKIGSEFGGLRNALPLPRSDSSEAGGALSPDYRSGRYHEWLLRRAGAFCCYTPGEQTEWLPPVAWPPQKLKNTGYTLLCVRDQHVWHCGSGQVRLQIPPGL